MDQPITNCYWVVPGQLLAGEYPRNLDDESSIPKLAALAEAGIVAFIDLTEDGEPHPYAQWLDSETQSHHRFPIRDLHTPGSPDLTGSILDTIDSYMVNGQPVYVHCWGGVGRTGTIVGCWLSRHGYPGTSALGRLDELWKDCPKSVWTRSPETEWQRQYVLDWSER